MAEKRTCGECMLCCKVVGVLELGKRHNEWCEHCDKGRGCKVYEDRPESCAVFECFWLSNPWIPDTLRPDRCKVVLEGMQEAEAVLVLCDPGRPDAWQDQPVIGFLQWLVENARISSVIARGPNLPPLIAAPPDVSNDDVMRGMARAGYANLRRYADQEGISESDAMAQMMDPRQ